MAGSLRKAEGIIHGDKAILGKRWNLSKAAAGHTTDFQKLAVRTGDIHGAETRPPPVSRSRDGLAWDSCCPGLGGCAHISRYPRSSRCASLLYRPGMLRTNKWLLPQTCFLPPSHRRGSKMDLEVTFLNWLRKCFLTELLWSFSPLVPPPALPGTTHCAAQQTFAFLPNPLKRCPELQEGTCGGEMEDARATRSLVRGRVSHWFPGIATH